MNRQRVKASALVCTAAFAMGLLSSCSSQADKEREFREKEKAILDAQGKGSSDAMKNWRFPDTSSTTKRAEPKRSDQK